MSVGHRVDVIVSYLDEKLKQKIARQISCSSFLESQQPIVCQHDSVEPRRNTPIAMTLRVSDEEKLRYQELLQRPDARFTLALTGDIGKRPEELCASMRDCRARLSAFVAPTPQPTPAPSRQRVVVDGIGYDLETRGLTPIPK